MKIGILTFWTSKDNYGQLLQAYALQKYLKSINVNAILIRYNYQKKEKLSISKFTPKHITEYIKYRLSLKKDNTLSYVYNFNTFKEKIIYSDKIYYSFKDLVSEDWSDFDGFICGSDQIWSPRSKDELQSYFLQFAPFQKLRIAYAPSFGRSQLDQEYKNLLPNLLSGFDALSVRESSGIDILKQAGYNGALVCDPTLLLTSEDYIKNLSIPLKENNRSLFCYFINWETNLDNSQILNFCNESNLKPSLFSTIGFKSPISLNPVQSPENWIAELANAKYSLVNSYHGLVFSIIFHKPFGVFLLNGKQGAMNSRIYSLLEYLNLTDRIVSADNCLSKIFENEIDWDIIDNKIMELRTSSQSYLNSSLKKRTYNNTAKYNICFLSNGAIHHKYGGLDRVTEILANKFEQDGNAVHFLSFKNRGLFDAKRQSFFPDSKNIKSESNIKFLEDFIYKNKINILINQEGNVDLCLPIKEDKNLKRITCLHFNPNYIDDNHFTYKFSDYRSPIKFVFTKIFSIPLIKNAALNYLRSKLTSNYTTNLDWCNKFVLLSPKFASSICALTTDNADLSKIEAIYNPNNILPPTNTTQKEKIILFVGRLDNKFKRIDQILKDIGVLLKKYPEWKFIVCGDGPDRDYLKTISQSISTNIEFTGYCDPTEYYKKANIIVLRSSKSEGWGMVLIEAMTFGVIPVVAGTYESLSDIISNNVDGLITPNNSIDFIASIEKIIKNQELSATMRLNAITKSQRFSTDKIICEWYNLFKKI